MTSENLNIPSQNISSSENWFQEIIHSIKVDELMYRTDTMEKEKRRMFNNMMDNNFEQVARDTRKLASKLIIPSMLDEYFKLISHKFNSLKKLAFEMSDSKILVWVEITQNDEDTEDTLILAEAKINGDFLKDGFRLLTTIVEDCDNLEVPQPFVKVAIPVK